MSFAKTDTDNTANNTNRILANFIIVFLFSYKNKINIFQKGYSRIQPYVFKKYSSYTVIIFNIKMALTIKKYS
jgi:hypothetical protein